MSFQKQWMSAVKTLCIALAATVLAALPAFGQGAQGAQIKQRAREVVNQNNVRQGVGQPSQPAASQPAQKPAASPAQIQQQNVNKIKADIAAILASAQVSEEKVKKLSLDLASAARGPKKPSSATIKKLADAIAKNLAGQTLASPEQLRLAQNLEAVVNASGMSQLKADSYVSDVQAVLQVAGVKRDAAIGTANEVKAVLSELRQ